MNPVLLLLVGVGFLAWQNSKDFASHYKIKFIDSIFNSSKTAASGYLTTYFSIRIKVENQSDFQGTMKGAELDISYKGKKLGNITLDKPVAITKNAATVVELPVAVPTLNLISNVSQLMQAINNTSSITFNVKGQLEFAIGTVNVNDNYKVTLK